MPERIVLKSEIALERPLAPVWEYLSNAQLLPDLCRDTLGIDIRLENSDTTLNDRLFMARIIPYDILLSSQGCSYAIRLIPADHGTTAIVAVSFHDTLQHQPRQESIDGMLEAIRKHVKSIDPVSTAVTDQEFISRSLPVAGGITPANTATDASDASLPPQVQPGNTASRLVSTSLPVSSEPAGIASHAPDIPHTHTTRTPQPTVFTSPAVKGVKKPKKKWKVGNIGIAAAAVLCVAAIAVWLILSPLDTGRGRNMGSPVTGEGVTLDNIASVSPGMDLDQVRELMKCEGQVFETDAGALLFQGGTLTGNGLYSTQLLVHHTGGAVVDLTYLDLNAQAGIAIPYGFVLTPDMEHSAIIDNVGLPPSMMRFYVTHDELYNEYHFGGSDRFANFNPAWRGEYTVTVNRTQGVITTATWPGFDSYDPLLVPDLQGIPLGVQYSSYTDYLNDAYVTSRAMLMLNGYSRGDAVQVFGDMILYNDQTGVNLYTFESDERMPDTDKPLYVICYGFDSTGMFLMSSFTNMRLFDLPRSLDQSGYASVTRGMNNNEVRKLVGVLPTAIFVDKDYYTLCWGSYTGRNSFDEQFQFMVKFSIGDHYVHSIWNNAGL